MLITAKYLNNEWFLSGGQVGFEKICCIKHWQKVHCLNIFLRKNCLWRYPSNNHIQRQAKRTKKDSGKTPVKHTKISRQPFHWNRQCLFCGEECLIEVDKKKSLSVRESHLSAKHLIGVKESCPSRRWFCRWREVSLPECLYYGWYLTRTKRVVSFCKHMFIYVIPIYFFLAFPLNTIIHFGIFVPCLLKTAPYILKNSSF